jgi:hypothetical protein
VVAKPVNRQDAKKQRETILISFRASDFLGVLAVDRPYDQGAIALRES